jgi:hypothetical protein
MDIEQLVALANYLDDTGATEEADKIDELIKDVGPVDIAGTSLLMPEEELKAEQQAQGSEIAKEDTNFGPGSQEELQLITKTTDGITSALEVIEKGINDIESTSMTFAPGPEAKRLVGELKKLFGFVGKESSVELNIFEKLSAIADRLDSFGAADEADAVDAFIAKHAAKKKEEPAPAAEAPVFKADVVMEHKPEADTEQSKRYDDKHHHSLQVREPKTNKERMDLEGYKGTHHVHTYQPVKEAMEKEAASTRYCPEHIGVTMGRVGEATFQCPLDGKTYNWEVGFTDYDGKHHEGGSVAAQTPDSSGVEIAHRVFDSRSSAINRVN